MTIENFPVPIEFTKNCECPLIESKTKNPGKPGGKDNPPICTSCGKEWKLED